MDLDALLFSLIHAFPNTYLFLGERLLNGIPDLLVGIILLVIGLWSSDCLLLLP